MPEHANPASELAKSRWKNLTREQRREQTAPARAARLAKRAEQLRSGSGEPEAGTSSYEDAIVAVVARAPYLDAEQKTLLAAEIRQAASQQAAV